MKLNREDIDKKVKSEIDSTLTSLDLKAKSNPWAFPAGLVSWLCVPLIVPVYGVILIFTLSLLKYLPWQTRLAYMMITFAINCVLPIISFAMMKHFGIISDIGLNKRRERTVPYIVTIMCMSATGLILWTKHAPVWVPMFFFGGVIAGLIQLCINKHWKISAHMAAMAGLVSMLVRMDKVGFPQYDLTWWIAGTILLTGLLGTCRVYLRRHTLLQVLAGATVGYTCVYLCMCI